MNRSDKINLRRYMFPHFTQTGNFHSGTDKSRFLVTEGKINEGPLLLKKIKNTEKVASRANSILMKITAKDKSRL